MGATDDPLPQEAQIARLLRRIELGEASARSELFELLYGELYQRASRLMQSQVKDRTLQPTLLVHEAFVKLSRAKGQGSTCFNNGDHFLAVASKAMRQVVVDHARGKRTLGRQSIDLESLFDEEVDSSLDVEALDLALTELATFDRPMAQAVELRVFGCCTADDTARVLGIPLRTFQRRWAGTMDWLRRRMMK